MSSSFGPLPRNADCSAPRMSVPIHVSQHARHLWDELSQGALTVSDRFELDGQRCLLLAVTSSGRARQRQLSPRELQVVALARDGEPMKLIGCALRISEASARVYLATARAKMGLLHRQEHIFWAGRVDEGAVTTHRQRERYLLSTNALRPKLASLSDAEDEVVAYAAAGLSNAQIAAARGVSAPTVVKQLCAAFRKLGVGSRFELARICARATVARDLASTGRCS